MKIGSPAACVVLLTLAGLIVCIRLEHPDRAASASLLTPATALPADPTPAPPPPVYSVLKNVDLREPGRAPPDRASLRDAAAAALRQEMPDVTIDFDDITGGPKNIISGGKFLSSPSDDPVARFVDTHRGLFGHDSSALLSGKSRITRDDTSAHNGMKTLSWHQELDGIPLFQTIFRANLTKTGQLITLGGNFLADPEAAAHLSAEKRAALVRQPPVAATRALVLAASDIRAEVEEKSVTITDGPQGIERKQEFQVPSISDTRASLTWVPTGSESVRLAWDITLMSVSRGEMFRILVSAEDGGILVRQSLTSEISNATYRVYARAADKQPRDSPTPLSPGQATPSNNQPVEIPRESITLSALDTIASPNGWIDDGVTETVGNNVDAHTDSDTSPNLPDLPRPASPTRNFDFPINLSNAPDAYRDAAVTQLFYVTNWTHDRLYQLGFTESAGNFQTNNFARGGLGNDAVLADAQDATGTNNANFSTPPDGSPGRMQMYVYNGPTPDIDGALDTEVVIHEYVHGLSNRLVGGGVGISAAQTQGLGEGWSDFYSLALLSEPGDDIHGNYAAAAYSTRLFSGLTQNYYFGIRRYPYSTDLTKNPLTFKDIDPAQADNHTGIPRNPIIGSSANDVHNQGEVWCAVLWDMRANLITKHGFATGNSLALQLVTDAMKLSPANPNFLQARDAIIQADLVNNAAADKNELWDAFARRGMGASASSPGANSTTGLIEAYDIPDDLRVTPLDRFTANGQIGGTISPASRVFTLSNNGGAALNWTATKTQPWLLLSPTSGTLPPGTTTTVTASFGPAASGLAFGAHSDTITFTNTGSGSTISRGVDLTIAPLASTVFAENFETGAFGSAWTITGTASHRTLVTGANEPHGGIYQMTMDSGLDNTYSRNEATLTLNLAGRQHLVLSFWVKMFSDEADAPATDPFTGGADFDGIAVSADGGTVWHEIRDLRSITNSWQKISINLDAAIAARGLAYNSSFKIRFNHYDNYSISTDGFAFDDILISETISNSLSITSPGFANEGDAPVTATLSVTPAPSSDLTVSLTSDRADATVPTGVVIPAGSGSVNFNITPVNDTFLDGSQTATITAAAPTYPNATRLFTVHDNESAALALTLPDEIIEGSSPSTGVVSLAAPVDTPVVVTLSSESSSLQLPADVTIPAGGKTAQFAISAINDNQINGSRPASVRAVVTNWPQATDTTTVLDDETTTLTLNLPVLREGDTGKVGSVSIPGTLPGNLTVNLASDDHSELTVPATVTIPAGQTSAQFPLTIVDDPETDGSQPVSLTATAAGFPPTTLSTAVQDNDVHHFSISPISGPVLRNAPVTVTVIAKDINDAVITNFSQSVTFGVPGVSVSPPSSAAFVNGTLVVSLSFATYTTAVALTVSDGAGHDGATNTFDIVQGTLDHFAWSSIPSPQAVDAPFPVTLRALDSAGNPVTSFTGPLALSAVVPDTVEILSWTAHADLSPTGEYAHAKQAIASHFTRFHEIPTNTSDATTLAGLLEGKHVFLIVEQENSTSSVLGATGTAWAAVLNHFVNTGGTVIACSNTNAEHLLLANSGLLDLTPLGSPSTIAVTKTADTPLNDGVTTPFDGSYLHTYSTTNGTVDLKTAANEAVVISRTLGLGRVVMIGTDFYTLGTEMDRVIANAVELAVQPYPSDLPVSPATTGNFANGEWSNTIRIPFAAPAVKLRATNGTLAADSEIFATDTIQPPSDSPSGGMFLTFPSQVTEGSGSISGSVGIAEPVAGDLTVHLVSKSPAKLSIPATVVIPAGQTSTAVPLTLPDDPFVDGTKNVIITASASGQTDALTTIAVLDDDGGSLGLALAPITQENSGTVAATLTLSVPALAPLTISLVSDHPDVALVPATVTLPRGATSLQLSVTIPDDTVIDGDQTANLTATCAGWSSTTAPLLVQDNENRNLVLSIPEILRESDPPKTGTVALNGSAAQDVVVSLHSSDTSEITVPDTIIIPGGQSSATFLLTIQNDLLADGPQPFTIAASSPTFVTAETGGIVLDNEAHHFTVAPVGSPQLKNGPVPVIITARDEGNAVIKDYDSPVGFTASGGSGPLAVSPAVGGGFVSGVWSGSVQIDALDTNVVITVSDGLGHTGSSNPFNLVNGSLDHFAWSAVSSPQTADTPFAVTLRAVDSGGATVNNYNGAANLFMRTATQDPPIGSGGTTTHNGIPTFFHDSRVDSLYTATEVGGAARITALSFDLTSVPAGGQILNNWTIRLKHTALTHLGATTAWDNSGWTTVYRSSPVISAAGRVTFTFATPFDYNGSSNLLVDCSMDRNTTSSAQTFVQATATPDVLSVYGGSNSNNGDPLAWSGANPLPNISYQRPDIRLTTVKELPIRPGHSGSFSNGIWTGAVSVPVAANNVVLIARAGPVSGFGNPFDVTLPAAPPNGSATILTENFESGSLNPTYWTSTGTANFRTQVTSSYNPHNGSKHLAMDSTSGAARNEATLTLNLAGRTGALLKFWAAGFNDEPNGPPPAPFIGGADFDGVAISADGNTWWEVQSLRSLPNTYSQFTVDLDAATAARGISYGTAFKIRFNQFDDNPFVTDGIVIDDILVTANAAPNITLSAPLQATEGGSPANGVVTLDAPAATDTVVFLSSNAPAKISVPVSVTVAAGQASAGFQLNFPDDEIADGNRSVVLTASVPGKSPGNLTVMLIDDEILPLSLFTPAVLAEGSPGPQTGTLTLGSAASGFITVSLVSSDTSELTVPSSVVFQPGQITAKFPITVLNDTRIDGPQNVTITAFVPGWRDVDSVVSVTDNETRDLTVSAASAFEGSPASGLVTISGTLRSNLTVILASSDTGQYSVPTSVTIPAGQTSAAFIGTAVDDSATDGAKTVNITASAAGFNSASTVATAYDNDLHHFAFSTIASPQKSGIPTAIAISARDVNNAVIAPFTGSALLTAGGDGGPLPITPGTVNFTSGGFAGNVVFLSAGSEVRLTAARAGVTGVSNAFDVEQSPAIAVAPTSISLTLDQGDAVTRTLSISNTGGGTLDWTLDSGPAGPPTNNESTPSFPLETVLANLNTNNSLIGPLIPNRHLFIDGITGTSINDGGGDMYDTGNILNTNLGGPLPYSDDTIIPNEWLGGGGRYFSRKYDGLWVFAADVSGLGYFEITGNLGADGSGSTDSSALTTISGGRTYRGFVKRVFNAGDPSVNHLIIIEDNGSASQQASTDTNNDFHRLSGLTGVTRVYDLLYAGTGGTYIDDAATLAIMNAFLDAISMPDWVSAATTSGHVTGGSTQGVILNISSDNLTPGLHSRVLTVRSNDPLQPEVSIPVDLTITNHGILRITPSPGVGFSGTRGGPFAPAIQTFTLTNTDSLPLDWTAGKSAAWFDISPASGSLAPGGSQLMSVTLNAASLAEEHYADTVIFTNTTNGRGNSTRSVSLTVTPAAPLLAPEPAFTGGTSNTIEWGTVPNTDFYEVQVASDADFNIPVDSSSPVGNAFTFQNLLDANSYHYRVRAVHNSTGGNIPGPWSSPAQSIQDAGAPSLVRDTPSISASAILVPQGGSGDAVAGVATVTVNGKSATLNPATGTWTAIPLLLQPGDSAISVTVSDKADPSNTLTEIWSVTYTGPATTDADGDKLPDLWESSHGLNPADNGGIDPQQGASGDPDGDSISNLLEYALGIDPIVRNSNGLPTVATNISDGKRYLTFQYRRRIERPGIHYVVETADNPGTWTDGGAAIEEISSSATGDGDTELCTVRVKPAIDIDRRKFVRLKVSVD